MKHILLFQGGCAACSQLAQKVTDLSIPGLEALPIESPEVTRLLVGAGVEMPHRPALLLIDGDRVDIRAGWGMRWRLARLIGFRRPTTLISLYLAERRAGRTRGLSTGDATSPMNPAKQADVQWALATAPVQAAVRTWGLVQPEAYEIGSGINRALVLMHGNGEAVTFVDSSANTSAKLMALSMGIVPAEGRGLRFSVNGTPLADATETDGKIQVATITDPEVAPDITKQELACILLCFHGSDTSSCAQNCIGCITGGVLAKALDCPQCYLCGYKIYECVDDCINGHLSN